MIGQEPFFGTNSSLTGEEALLLLEAAISEGLLLPTGAPAPSTPNLFGRMPLSRTSSDLSFLSGLAAAGLRGAAFLPGPQLTDRYEDLHALSRQLLPVVLHLLPSPRDSHSFSGQNEHSVYHQIADAGFFQFFAADAQEALDLAIIAHRVAEGALVPGICAMDEAPAADAFQSVAVPGRDLLSRFLGDPDDHISCPTPAQRMLFGKGRRRVPQWFNLDLPVLSGAAKTKGDRMLEAAARRQYIQRHLPDLIQQAMVDFEAVIGRKYTPLGAYQTDKADYLVLTQGASFAEAKKAVDHLRSHEKARVGCLNLRQFRPFPAAALLAQLSGKKGVAILESVGGEWAADGPIYREVGAALTGQVDRMPVLFAGAYGEAPSPESVISAFRNMMRGGGNQRHFYLGVDFTRASSRSPQHEVLLQAIAREYPDLARQTLAADAGPTRVAPGTETAATRQPEIPQVVRRYRDQGPPYSHLSRFYHDTALFYQQNDKQELVADPFQAVDAVPPATTLFHPPVNGRERLPVFRPENCTGCGRCVVYCPHAALPPLAIGLEALINAGMRTAAARGDALTQFIPLVKNLARLAATAIQAADTPVTRVADFLPAAFEKLLGQLAFPEEKAALVRREWPALLSGIADLPVAVTETFFSIPQQREKGSGALFSLAVDPNACTGCGLCAEVCETDAFDLAPATTELEEELNRTFSRWEQLPDTAPEWIDRLIHDPDFDSFAAVLLSRHYYQSMAGGGASEAGAPAKTIVHLVTALVESIVQSRIVQQTRKLDDLIETLSTAIHSRLSDALPRDNFQVLQQAMREAGAEQLSFEELVGRLGAHEHLQRIDTDVLRRKVDLVNDLRDLRRVLLEGPTGGGRSRFGLVMQQDAWPWLGQFPYNGFVSPIVLSAADSLTSRVAGLMEGHLRHALDQVRLMRRARLEARDQYRPDVHAREIAGVAWQDLAEEEKDYVAPILLIGTQQLLEQGLSGLPALLTCDRPVKILVLDDGVLSGSRESAAPLRQSGSAFFSNLEPRQAFILRDVLEHSGRLFDGLREGLHTARPALFHLYAPAREQHRAEAGAWPALSTLALRSRAFPAFTFFPEAAPDGRPADFSVAGNPEVAADWCTVPLRVTEEGQEKTFDYTLTYADWLFTLKSWKNHFESVSSSANLTPLAGYLALDPAARTGKTPVIWVVNEAGERQVWTVSPQVVTATQAAARQWNLLRTLGGAVTPFPQKLRQAVAQELSEKHARELAQLRTDYEAQLQRQEQDFMERVKIRLREKLLALSQQRAK